MHDNEIPLLHYISDSLPSVVYKKPPYTSKVIAEGKPVAFLPLYTDFKCIKLL